MGTAACTRMLSQLATRITTTLPLPPSWIRRADVHIDTLQGLTPIRHSIHLATLELVTFLFSLPLPSILTGPVRQTVTPNLRQQWPRQFRSRLTSTTRCRPPFSKFIFPYLIPQHTAASVRHLDASALADPVRNINGTCSTSN